jgi:hypothetical protein
MSVPCPGPLLASICSHIQSSNCGSIFFFPFSFLSDP